MLELIGLFTLLVIFITIAESESHVAYIFLIVFLIAAGLLNYHFNWLLFGSVFNYVKTNPGLIFLWMLAYVASGALYIILRWYWYVQDCWEDELDYRTRFSKTSQEFYRRPEVNSNTERILRWGSFWIFSLAWNLVKHPLRNIYKFLLRKFGYILENITNSTFKKV